MGAIGSAAAEPVGLSHRSAPTRAGGRKHQAEDAVGRGCDGGDGQAIEHEHLQGFIKAKVASRIYGNATEVIHNAIQRMQAEESRIAAWQAAIKVGDNQLDRGEGIACTSDTLNDITRSTIGAMHGVLPFAPSLAPGKAFLASCLAGSEARSQQPNHID